MSVNTPLKMGPANQSQIQRAISQMTDKAPATETNLTLHTLEDGNIVSTQERVAKDVRPTRSHSLLYERGS